MNYQVKVILISFTTVLAISFMGMMLDNSIDTGAFLIIFGIIGFFGGLAELITGLFLLLHENKKYAQAFLMSGGLLMLVGFTSCTAAFSTLH